MDEIRYREAKDGWRWRIVAPNERIVAESGEAYSTKGNCIRSIERLQGTDLAQLAVVEEA